MKENETPNQGKDTNGNVNEVQKQGMPQEEQQKQKEGTERELGTPEPFTKKRRAHPDPRSAKPFSAVWCTQPAKTEPTKPVTGQKERGL